jgi:hypothetical protein
MAWLSSQFCSMMGIGRTEQTEQSTEGESVSLAF